MNVAFYRNETRSPVDGIWIRLCTGRLTFQVDERTLPFFAYSIRSLKWLFTFNHLITTVKTDLIGSLLFKFFYHIYQVEVGFFSIS